MIEEVCWLLGLLLESAMMSFVVLASSSSSVWKLKWRSSKSEDDSSSLLRTILTLFFLRPETAFLFIFKNDCPFFKLCKLRSFLSTIWLLSWLLDSATFSSSKLFKEEWTILGSWDGDYYFYDGTIEIFLFHCSLELEVIRAIYRKLEETKI